MSPSSKQGRRERMVDRGELRAQREARRDSSMEAASHVRELAAAPVPAVPGGAVLGAVAAAAVPMGACAVPVAAGLAPPLVAGLVAATAGGTVLAGADAPLRAVANAPAAGAGDAESAEHFGGSGGLAGAPDVPEAAVAAVPVADPLPTLSEPTVSAAAAAVPAEPVVLEDTSAEAAVVAATAMADPPVASPSAAATPPTTLSLEDFFAAMGGAPPTREAMEAQLLELYDAFCMGPVAAGAGAARPATSRAHETETALPPSTAGPAVAAGSPSTAGPPTAEVAAGPAAANDEAIAAAPPGTPSEQQAVVAAEGAPTYAMSELDRQAVLAHSGSYRLLDENVRRRLTMGLNRTCKSAVLQRWTWAKTDRTGALQLEFLQEWARDPQCGFCTVRETQSRTTKQATIAGWGWRVRDELVDYYNGNRALVDRICARTQKKRNPMDPLGQDPELDLYWVWLKEDVSKHDDTVQQRSRTVHGEIGNEDAAEAGRFTLAGTNYLNSIPAPMAEVEGSVAADGQKKPPKRKSGADGSGCGRASKKPNSEARQKLEKRRKRATQVLGSMRALRATLPDSDTMAGNVRTVLEKEADNLGTARARADEAVEAWERGNMGEEELQGADEALQDALKQAEDVVAQGKLRVRQLGLGN